MPLALFVCRIGPGHFPSAKAIQELITGWKRRYFSAGLSGNSELGRKVIGHPYLCFSHA